MRMEEREADKSMRVALGGAAAVLRCPCGAVGAVSDADVGDGQVACPGCAARYCVTCGNAAHPETECPPPSDMIKWLAKKTKKCPKCKESIEKAAGSAPAPVHRGGGLVFFERSARGRPDRPVGATT